jgi:hypothetical protein
MALQAGFHIGDPAGGDHTGVTDHQDLARTKGLGVIADVVPQPAPKMISGETNLRSWLRLGLIGSLLLLFLGYALHTSRSARMQSDQSHSQTTGQREAGRGESAAGEVHGHFEADTQVGKRGFSPHGAILLLCRKIPGH